MTDERPWITELSEIAKDLEKADVRQLLYKRLGGKVSCSVVVRNADGDLVTWEFVADDASADRWRKVSTVHQDK